MSLEQKVNGEDRHYSYILYESKATPEHLQIGADVVHMVNLLREAGVLHADGTGMNADAPPEAWFELDNAPWGTYVRGNPSTLNPARTFADVQNAYEGFTPEGNILNHGVYHRTPGFAVIGAFRDNNVHNRWPEAPMPQHEITREYLNKIRTVGTVPRFALAALKGAYVVLLTAENTDTIGLVNAFKAVTPYVHEAKIYTPVTHKVEPVKKKTSLTQRLMRKVGMAETPKLVTETQSISRDYILKDKQGHINTLADNIYAHLKDVINKQHPHTLREYERREEDRREDEQKMKMEILKQREAFQHLHRKGFVFE